MFKFGLYNFLFVIAAYGVLVIALLLVGYRGALNEMHLLAFLAFAVTCFYVTAPRDDRVVKLLPAFSANVVSDIGFGVLFGVSIFLAIVGLAAFFCGLPFVPTAFVVLNFYPLLLIVFVAASEEIIFRGYVFGFFRSRVSLPASIMINALLFSAAHGFPISAVEFIARALLGVLLSLIVTAHGNLLRAVLIHATLNYGIGLASLGAAPPYNHPGVLQFSHPDANVIFLVTQSVVVSACSWFLWVSLRKNIRVRRD